MKEVKESIQKALLSKRSTLSASTLKTYSTLLYTLQKRMSGEGIEWYEKEHEAILKHIQEMPIAQTRKTLLSALYVLTGIQSYKEEMSKEMKTVNEKYTQQKTSDKRKEHLISYDEVKSIHNDLVEKAKKNPTHENIVNALISYTSSGALGVQLPPRRLEYAEMKMKNFHAENDNFIDWKRKLFVFNRYKTYSKHGSQTIPIPKEVMPLLTKWKKANNSDYMLIGERGESPMASNTLSRRIKKLFRGNSQDALRSIFLSNYYKDIPKLQEMNELSENMGHSVSSALTYYVKKD